MKSFPMKFPILLVLLAFLGLSACNNDTQTTTVTLDPMAFEWSGPLLEGSNPAQVTVTVDPKVLLGDLWKEGVEIKRVELKKAEVNAENNEDFAGILSLVMSMASNNPELRMQEIAAASPLQPEYNKASLNMAPQAHLDDFFKEKEFYMVLDASLQSDREQDLRLTGQVTFEITYR